jgi:hypothetical protein
MTKVSKSGVLSFVGYAAELTGQLLGGALSFVSTATSKPRKAVAAFLDFPGTLSSKLDFGQGLGAILSFVGQVRGSVRTRLIGSLSFSGAISRGYRSFRSFTGAITPSGAISQFGAITKALSGLIGPSGSLRRHTRRPLAAILRIGSHLGRYRAGLWAGFSRGADLDQSFTGTTDQPDDPPVEHVRREHSVSTGTARRRIL